LVELAIFDQRAVPNGAVDPLLNAFIPRIRRLVGPRNALEPERVIGRRITNWDYWIHSEDAVDSTYATKQAYQERAGGEDLDPDFDDATAHGRDITEEVQKAIVAALGDRRSLVDALELGILVDRGVRPPDSPEFVLRQERIPDSSFRSYGPPLPVRLSGRTQGMRRTTSSGILRGSSLTTSMSRTTRRPPTRTTSTGRAQVVASSASDLVVHFCRL
jgi:hypothetical protein